MAFELFELIDQMYSRPLAKTPKVSLRFLQLCYAWISVLSIWYIVFGAWFLHGAGTYYKFVTLSMAFILSIAFFYDSDGRGWKKFATLCVICALPRLFVSPIYAVANIQTSNVNATNTPDFIESFHTLNMWGFQDKYNHITLIWFVYYYNFMLIIMSMQRVSCRKAVEEKKQKIYAENVKIQESKRVENEQGTGPMHI
ncbi:hypothetical protein GCK72_009811 [Caenorhabditis remanei]|uniref:Uncharacterized protein n=1 Tax=Caenorhabditis remanei TaxID=31234 RepID=A0A6A5H3K4_CAERE|nr:hypothetical protein GCK72_009811 [Caenorhabditis remanei]KAF1761555.1 hypothetical protein GCK72_009811 [Caenorhabditis remanei]